MTIPKLKPDAPRVNKLAPDSVAEGAPWRTMTACDALAYLVAEDVARRTEAKAGTKPMRARPARSRQSPTAGRVAPRERSMPEVRASDLPADEAKWKHCPLLPSVVPETAAPRHNRNLNDRGAAPWLGMRAPAGPYHKIVHGKPPPKLVTPAVAAVVTPAVTAVTPVVTPVTPKVVTPVTQKHGYGGRSYAGFAPPLQNEIRAEYMRRYRANRAKS